MVATTFGGFRRSSSKSQKESFLPSTISKKHAFIRSPFFPSKATIPVCKSKSLFLLGEMYRDPGNRAILQLHDFFPPWKQPTCSAYVASGVVHANSLQTSPLPCLDATPREDLLGEVVAKTILVAKHCGNVGPKWLDEKISNSPSKYQFRDWVIEAILERSNCVEATHKQSLRLWWSEDFRWGMEGRYISSGPSKKNP